MKGVLGVFLCVYVKRYLLLLLELFVTTNFNYFQGCIHVFHVFIYPCILMTVAQPIDIAPENHSMWQINMIFRDYIALPDVYLPQNDFQGLYRFT